MVRILSVFCACAFFAAVSVFAGLEGANALVKVVGTSTNEVGAANAVVKKHKRPVKITAANTYYDNKEGVAIFTGHVHVNDEEYDIHADKAYAFTAGTNGISRIVAVGHIAMTNGMKRAYGHKVSYHRENGMVVLHSGDGIRAEVRDCSKKADQVVYGSKIRFWIETEQVEVLNAEISAPTEGIGGGDLKTRLLGK